MQQVAVQRQPQVALVRGLDDPPALHLARTEPDDRLPLPVDGDEARGGFRPDRVVDFDRSQIVEHHLVEDEHALDGVGDLRYAGEIALHDQRAGHPTGDLDVSAPVMVGVVPVGAARVVGGDGDLDVVTLPWFHAAQDIVGVAAGTDVQTMDVDIRGVEVMRQVGIERQLRAVRRQVVDQGDAEDVTWLHAKRRSGDGSFIGA